MDYSHNTQGAFKHVCYIIPVSASSWLVSEHTSRPTYTSYPVVLMHRDSLTIAFVMMMIRMTQVSKQQEVVSGGVSPHMYLYSLCFSARPPPEITVT